MCGRLAGEPHRARGGATASRTARCACPTACAGTSSRSSPRRSTACARRPPTHELRSVGVDAWGVDYALLDARGRVLGLPFHYRDERTVGHGRARARARLARASCTARPASRRCRSTPSSSCSRRRTARASRRASRIALVPDLIASWLSGVVANEATAASTTGLLDARSGRWADDLIERLGLPSRIFGELVEPGTVVGALLPHHELGDVPVCAVAAHDTASAFVAAPLRDRSSAVLSSGTWSLLGLELDEPVLDEDAQALQPLQRARRRRHDAPAAQRHGPLAAAGVPPLARADGRERVRGPAAPGRGRERRRAAVRPRRRGPAAPGRHARAHREACVRAGQRRAGLDRRARAQHPRLAGLQVPARARAARAGHAAAASRRST